MQRRKRGKRGEREELPLERGGQIEQSRWEISKTELDNWPSVRQNSFQEGRKKKSKMHIPSGKENPHRASSPTHPKKKQTPLRVREDCLQKP